MIVLTNPMEEAIWLGADDILFDLQGTEIWSHRAPPQGLEHSLRSRSVTSTGGGLGRQLLARCGADAVGRLETLVHIERDFPPNHDSGVLVVWASQLIETVLNKVIAVPLHPLSAALAAAAQVKAKDKRAAEALELWGSGRLPTTIGMVLNILLALRRAQECGQADLQQFLDRTFHPHYVELLRGNHLARVLDRIRERYRNPAAHGLKTFSAEEYNSFAQLAVARPRFKTWDYWGAEPPEPPADLAVLHHHLTGVRWPDSEMPASPLSRLLALASPPASRCGVQIQIEPAATQRTRDLRFATKQQSSAFRLNTDIEIAVTCQADAWGLVIDVGTSGSVAALWPSAFDKLGRLFAARTESIPSAHWPAPLTLSGATGTERVIAIAALDPLPGNWLPPANEPFREIKPIDLESLLAHLESIDHTRWSIATLVFEIET